MLSRHDQLAIAHATFACVAVFFTLPIAVLSGRYLRPRGAVWFQIHQFFAATTAAIIVIVFGLGLACLPPAHLTLSLSPAKNDLHHKLGVAVFCFVAVQAILGFTAHNFKSGHITRRIHIPFGILTISALYWQTWEGLHNEWAETSTMKTATPMAIQILFWVFFLVSVTPYVLAAGQTLLGLLADNTAPVDVMYAGAMKKRNVYEDASSKRDVDGDLGSKRDVDEDDKEPIPV